MVDVAKYPYLELFFPFSIALDEAFLANCDIWKDEGWLSRSRRQQLHDPRFHLATYWLQIGADIGLLNLMWSSERESHIRRSMMHALLSDLELLLWE